MWSAASGLPLPVDVECYAGYRGEETPRRFGRAEAKIEVAGVIDCWLAPDHRYFKVRDGDGDLYILRNDVASERWELTFLPAPRDRREAVFAADGLRSLVGVGSLLTVRSTTSSERRQAVDPLRLRQQPVQSRIS